MVYVKKISAVVCALLVCLLIVLSINIQETHAVDLNVYPEYLPNNLVVMEIEFDSTLYSDPFYMGLPLPADNIVDQGNRWSIRDSEGDVLGFYMITYSEGLLYYTFAWNYPVVEFQVDFNNLVFVPEGSSMVFCKVTGDYPMMGSFIASSFHINRGLVGEDLVQTVENEPLSATFPQQEAGTYLSAQVKASSYDVFVQYYNLFIEAPGESFTEFTIAVPSRYFEPLDITGPLSDSLDFSQSLSDQIVVSDFPSDWTSWLATALTGFVEFEFAPGLSIGLLFSAIFGVLMLWFLLHLFM